MKFDELLTKHLGEFGFYQKWQFFLLCLPNIFTCLHAFSWSFIAADIPFRCLVLNESDSSDQPFFPENNYTLWLWDNKTHKIKESCKRLANVSVHNWNESERFDRTSEDCVDQNNHWQLKWDNSEISRTAIQEWTIVCERRWLKAFIQSVYFFGQLLGSVFWGVTADKYGRKNVLISGIIVQVIVGIVMAFVPWWPLFAVLRTILGFTHPGIYLVAIVLTMEIMGPTRRQIGGGIILAFFSAGNIFLGGLAYFIRDYKHLQLAITLPALIFISYLRSVSESPRWLICRGRLDEANVILKRMAKWNKSSLPEDWDRRIESPWVTNKSCSKTSEVSCSFKDLVKTPKIRCRLLICCICIWPSVSMAYYGLAMNPNFLGGNVYLSFVVGGILDAMAVLIYTFSMNIMGRKVLIILGFFIAGICLFTTLALSDEGNFIVFVILFGKMNLTGPLCVIYVFTAELFPAIIRSLASGVCSMGARVSVMISSFISFYMIDTSKSIVVIVYGIICLIGGIMTMFLPETTGQMQLETIEEAESFGRNQPLIVFGWQMTTKTAKLVTSEIKSGLVFKDSASASSRGRENEKSTPADAATSLTLISPSETNSEPMIIKEIAIVKDNSSKAI